MKKLYILILLFAMFGVSSLFSQISETTDPDFGIIAPEYGSPIFKPGTLDDTGAAFVILRFTERAKIPIDGIHGIAFFPRMESNAINPAPGNQFVGVKARIDNSDGAYDLQSNSIAGLDGGKKNWWGFMLAKRSDSKSGILPTAIWFAERGPYNFNSLSGGNPYLVVKSGESLLLYIVWEVPSDLAPRDMAIEYVDVQGFYSYFIRLDRAQR